MLVLPTGDDFLLEIRDIDLCSGMGPLLLVVVLNASMLMDFEIGGYGDIKSDPAAEASI